MADWILIACLKRLMADVTVLAPNRDHASDGSIGDTAHQEEVSDHNPDETGSVPIHDADHINEVHAIDVDSDLRSPGLTMEMVVQFILGRCRSGAETRLRYVIYNRRIWEAGNGWRERAYTGSSPHTEHAHFSASYTTGKEADDASWHLGSIPVALTADDKAWISEKFAEVAGDVWDQKIGNPDYPNRTAIKALNDLSMARDAVADPAVGAQHVAAGTPLALVIAAVTAPDVPPAA